jgi:uncharacterized protein (TIGR04222 family)
MALAAATAETWGISGPAFLLAYLLIALAVGVSAGRAKGALADVGTASSLDELADRPHDVAFLNGGSELAVYSALSAMHLRGRIVTSHGNVQAAGRLEPDTDALEKAIHFTAAGSVPRRRLVFHRPVQTALRTIEDRLVTSGFLLSEDRRRQIRRVGFWMLGVAGLGLVRVLAVVAEARPVGFLVIAMLVVTVVAAVQLSLAPRRSRQGEQALAALRAEHPELSPEVVPDWRVHGPSGAALGIGIFGTSALWASDPGFAGEIEAQRILSEGSSGGSGTAGSAGGFAVSGGGDGGSGAVECGGGGCGG